MLRSVQHNIKSENGIALYHEIKYTQKVFKIDPKDHVNSQRNLLDTVNKWTVRRNYHKILKVLGRESIIHGKEMKEKRFVHAKKMRNFDTLLKYLGIKEEELLDELTKTSEMKRTDLFDDSVSKLLGGMTKVKSVERIKEALQNISAFKSYFDDRYLQ